MSTESKSSGDARGVSRRRQLRHILWAFEGLALAIAIGAACSRGWLIRKAEGMLAERITSRLAASFHAPVTLDSLQISLRQGLKVYGQGLRVRGTAEGMLPGGNLIEVSRWEFHTTILGLMGKPLHLNTLLLRGVTVDIPMRGRRGQIHQMGGGGGAGRGQVKIDRAVCEDAVLLVERQPEEATGQARPPVRIEIGRVEMDGVAPDRRVRYEVRMRNPKPVGEIEASGSVGPWAKRKIRELPLDGEYRFTRADLGTLSGIRGMLSSRGDFRGVLGKVAVQGTTETPDFGFNTSDNRFALHTRFQAVVNGTNGDVRLERVRGRFLGSEVMVTGSVMRVMEVAKDPESRILGHDTELEVEMTDARVEDVLTAGVRGAARMTGRMELKTHMSVPPGRGKMMDRMRLLDGWLRISQGRFPVARVQENVNRLSVRSEQGAKAAKGADAGTDMVDSTVEGDFTMEHRVATFSSLRYSVPGAEVDATGQYRFVGKTYDFHGRARLKEKASQLTTGWKSFVLKALNPVFEKDGAGTDVPVEVSGTGSDLNWRLDYGHKDGQKRTGDGAGQGRVGDGR